MKIMLICAGGLSTSILMNKMKKWASENGADLEVKAYGLEGYERYYNQYDYVLLGPQIAYKYDAILKTVDKPVFLIEPFDYAMGDAAKIIGMIQK